MWLDSCAYGSVNRKPFAFIGTWCEPHLASAHRRCPGHHTHVRVKGQLTKGSAVYCPGVADALAQVVAKTVRDLRRKDEKEMLITEGCENVAINELTQALP